MPGESHSRQRSLAGHTPRGCKESDTTEWLTSNSSNTVFTEICVHVFCPFSYCIFELLFWDFFLLHIWDTSPSLGILFANIFSQSVAFHPLSRIFHREKGFDSNKVYGSEVKVSAWNAGDPGSIPGSGISPGEGNGNPLQFSCLENPMEGGAW